MCIRCGLNRFSASHDIDLFFSDSNATPIYRRRIVIDVTTRQGT